MSNFAYKGKTLRMNIGGKSILHEIEFNWSESTEFQELASKDVENDVNPGKSVYNCTGNGYADNSAGDAQQDVKAMLDLRAAKTKETFEIADAVSGNLNITGNAYIESVEITSSNDEVVTYSFTLRVTDRTVGETL